VKLASLFQKVHQIVYLVWSTLIPNALFTGYILSKGHAMLNTTLNRGKTKLVWAALIDCVLYYCGARYLQLVEIFNHRGPRYDRCPCYTELEQESECHEEESKPEPIRLQTRRPQSSYCASSSRKASRTSSRRRPTVEI
jgi:hypothetical protein